MLRSGCWRDVGLRTLLVVWWPGWRRCLVGAIGFGRLSRAGNRRLNLAIDIAAIAQIRYDNPGRAYFRRKLGEDKSRREALRCLKRRISDAVWRQLQLDRETDQHQDQAWPRWPSARGDLPSYRSPDTPTQNGQPKKAKTMPA